ncbi:DUF799 domain-containing protein [Pseudoduganella plicata]|uniref:Lipoprotein n=1 Tax=Pseudoduganella plicata TaxID=321984 RepID=A0A4P7BC53_9BURK|nr:GNA1162 family protein [Pseudoduganella plicata]QBQ36216.1 hypothetical protein E1742_08660 [Pseudoduganella plicata]GGY76874.1 lipoprotein [Pseudoduganella plicata]
MKSILQRVLALATVAIVVTGCATPPQAHNDYTAFRQADPRSVLVVPVVSRSVDVDAPDYFLSTISQPIAERGYYVFPVNLIKRVMEDDGLGDANLVHASATPKLAELFGADAVLYVVIERWDSKYAVISTTTTVELSYSLRNGKTGDELWKHSETMAYDPAGGQNGLLAKAIVAAFEKAKPNYIPLAKSVNGISVARAGRGLPAGPYDAKYKTDQQQY